MQKTNGSASEGVSNKTRDILLSIKKRPPERLDRMVQAIHHEVFDETDCLACGACCKTISPIINQPDMLRLAKAMRLTPVQFEEKYLTRDEGDWVFKAAPCPFLEFDNRCGVYKVRPIACRNYPHTDRRRFYQLIELSLKNAQVCPAVATILDRLAEKLA